ncbi:hypothetical protein CSHISOI_09020 [Colletotrichum shisoi]|uniref:Uncharacterized protein n=1 Tax=Colletotrichum shisoi TaxID=2078593 RepID=A0A5Q4BHK0_9PEZI|nr:hypothetical protein CSHISOI_09020 [Colletotrichum shisoi]
MAPVIMRGKQQRLMRAPDTGDNFNTIHAHIVGCNTVPPVINPHYSLLKKTRLSFAKAVSMGPYAIDQFPDAIKQEINEEAVLEYRKDIDYKLHLGVPCEPIQNTSLHPLSFAALDRTSPNSFQMMDFFWPKMKPIEYPKTIGQAVLEALEALPHDLVLDNVALALALIWCRLMDEVDFYPELLVKVGSNARKRPKIKPVSLIVFLVYGSHFLRLHSWLSLAVYGHPFRAISSLYENDVAFHKDLQLDPKLVDELAIRTEFRMMNLQKDD